MVLRVHAKSLNRHHQIPFCRDAAQHACKVSAALESAMHVQSWLSRCHSLLPQI